MKTLIVIFIFLIASALTTLVFMEAPGYVLFAYKEFSVETSLAVLIIVTAGSMILLYGLVRLLVSLVNVPSRMKEQRSQKKAAVCHKGLAMGLSEMIEGRWSKAEKILVQSARRGDAAVLNYLAAARAAQMQGAYERRDDYLREAALSDPSAHLQVGLTQVELQLDHGEYDAAWKTLGHLQDFSPNHPQIKQLQARLSRETGNNAMVLDILPDLRKSSVVAKDSISEMEEKAFKAMAEGVQEDKDAVHFEGAWVRLPKRLRYSATFAEPYARVQMRLGRGDRAEATLREALKYRWDPSLVRLYGQLDSGDVNRALGNAERWLRSVRNDPVLFLALGRLSARAGAYKKAKAYLESCVELKPSAEAYALLAHVLDQAGEAEPALQACRRWHELLINAEKARTASSTPATPAAAH